MKGFLRSKNPFLVGAFSEQPSKMWKLAKYDLAATNPKLMQGSSLLTMFSSHYLSLFSPLIISLSLPPLFLSPGHSFWDGRRQTALSPPYVDTEDRNEKEPLSVQQDSLTHFLLEHQCLKKLVGYGSTPRDTESAVKHGHNEENKKLNSYYPSSLLHSEKGN